MACTDFISFPRPSATKLHLAHIESTLEMSLFVALLIEWDVGEAYINGSEELGWWGSCIAVLHGVVLMAGSERAGCVEPTSI